MANPLLLVGLLGAYLFGRGEVARFESDAARDILATLGGTSAKVEIRSSLGPEAIFGDVASVSINAGGFHTDGLPLFTEPGRPRTGWVRNLHLDLHDFSLRGLRVESLQADIQDSAFDLGLAISRRKIRLSRSGVGPGKVVLLAKDIQDFILKKFKEVKRCSVRIDRDKIWIEGFGEFIIFKTDFMLVGRLEAQDGTKLIVNHARILFDGKVADEGAKQALLDTLNPVIDLRTDLGLFDAVRVEKITARDGRVVVAGTVKIPDLPKEAR